MNKCYECQNDGHSRLLCLACSGYCMINKPKIISNITIELIDIGRWDLPFYKLSI